MPPFNSWFSLQNILQQVWAKAGRPNVALTYSRRAERGFEVGFSPEDHG